MLFEELTPCAPVALRDVGVRYELSPKVPANHQERWDEGQDRPCERRTDREHGATVKHVVSNTRKIAGRRSDPK